MRRYSLVLIVVTAVGVGLFLRSTQSGPTPPIADLHSALDEFKSALDERWAYRQATRADFDGAIGALRQRISAGMSLDEFGLELHKIIALGLDGHSGVDGYKLTGTRYLPFLIEPDGERWIAFNVERTAFLADRFPYLTHIDGLTVGEWCNAAAVLVPKGSLQYVRHRCLTVMRNLDFVRRLIRQPERDSVDVTLASPDGNTTKTLTLHASSTPADYGKWPSGGSRVLEGNIGYLRLVTLGRRLSVQEIEQWMPRFRHTTGLIIDVRDNAGGDRDALQLVYSYLAERGDPPRVFNAAAYRIHEAHPEDHLARNHRMYRRDARDWSDADRQAIDEFVASFKAKWGPPKGQFSDWHYMALSPLDDPDVYQYKESVVVLMNGKSFSATDIFLAGLKGMKNVTLLGTPSAGGSAFTQEVALGTTGLRLRIGSMASFQADGRLFDGHGVRPDVIVEPTPDFYIGGPDNLLAEAIGRLAGR